MKKKVNLADRKAAFELLKKLYTVDENEDESTSRNSPGGPGAKSPGELVKLSSDSKAFFLQE